MLQDAGIEVRSDTRSALMHNKFWIFDGETVWTGSTNITESGIFKQDNNTIVIQSPALAAIYENEFQEMWNGEYGPRDVGPTFFLYRRVLDEIYADAGFDLKREVPMTRLDPQYRLVFGAGGELLATPDIERMERAIAALSPKDAPSFSRFLADNRVKLELFRPCLETPFLGWKDVLTPRMLGTLPGPKPWAPLDQDLRSYFKDERVRLSFSFESKYLGMSPFTCPSLFRSSRSSSTNTASSIPPAGAAPSPTTWPGTVIELQQRVNLINKIHLFNGLNVDDLPGIAEKFEEIEIPANRTVFKRGDKPEGLYIIFKGKVNVTRRHETKGEEMLIWLVAGDYFGEEALVENRNRSATITTAEDTTLLFLSRRHFDELLVNYPNLKPNFLVAIESHKLARTTRFSWLGPKEIIYFVARRHKIRLYQALIVPVLSLVVPIGLFLWGTLVGAVTPIALAILSLVATLLWMGWTWLDWSNDYYIVTNQRVIWLEKVVFLYDSREEAPLSTILSVGVETDQLGRILDYGNVIVRTFVGRIEFDYVDHPHQAAEMIREYWERVKGDRH